MVDPARRLQALCDDVRALSLIGASLKLRSSPRVDPEIHRQITLGAAASLQHATVDEGAASALLGAIEMTFAEAGELLRCPDRPGEWTVDDVDLLQVQGQASRFAFKRILSLAETRPALAATLRGRFLDVGTGVGSIALEAAQACPDLIVEGIDIWTPALALARRNIAESAFADRVSVEHRDVADLEPGRRYTLVWLPTMFLKTAVLERALDRIAGATVRGGYLVASHYTVPNDPAEAAFAALRTLRSGGEPMPSGGLAVMLHTRGWIDVETVEGPLATFTLARLA